MLKFVDEIYPWVPFLYQLEVTPTQLYGAAANFQFQSSFKVTIRVDVRNLDIQKHDLSQNLDAILDISSVRKPKCRRFVRRVYKKIETSLGLYNVGFSDVQISDILF